METVNPNSWGHWGAPKDPTTPTALLHRADKSELRKWGMDSSDLYEEEQREATAVALADRVTHEYPGRLAVQAALVQGGEYVE